MMLILRENCQAHGCAVAFAFFGISSFESQSADEVIE